MDHVKKGDLIKLSRQPVTMQCLFYFNNNADSTVCIGSSEKICIMEITTDLVRQGFSCVCEHSVARLWQKGKQWHIQRSEDEPAQADWAAGDKQRVDRWIKDLLTQQVTLQQEIGCE